MEKLILKLILNKKSVCVYGIDLFGCNEHVNEYTGSTKSKEFLYYVSELWLPKK